MPIATAGDLARPLDLLDRIVAMLTVMTREERLVGVSISVSVGVSVR